MDLLIYSLFSRMYYRKCIFHVISNVISNVMSCVLFKSILKFSFFFIIIIVMSYCTCGSHSNDNIT